MTEWWSFSFDRIQVEFHEYKVIRIVMEGLRYFLLVGQHNMKYANYREKMLPFGGPPAFSPLMNIPPNAAAASQATYLQQQVIMPPLQRSKFSLLLYSFQKFLCIYFTYCRGVTFPGINVIYVFSTDDGREYSTSITTTFSSIGGITCDYTPTNACPTSDANGNSCCSAVPSYIFHWYCSDH